MASKREFYIDNEEIFWKCSRCKDFFPEHRFSVCSTNPDGINYVCKECNKYYSRKKKTEYRLHAAPESTKTKTIDILQRMGFDVTESISDQFNEVVKNKYGVDLS